MSTFEKLIEITSFPPNMVAFQELIFELEDLEPDKRTKQWIMWRDKMNYFMREYNRQSKVGQIYLLIKDKDNKKNGKTRKT